MFTPPVSPTMQLKITMNRMARAVVMLAAVALLMMACAHANDPQGPGMILTFVGLKKGLRIDIDTAKLPDGRAFSHAGTFGPNKNWLTGGATMGAAPDTRELPEWVEFEWSERIYGKRHTVEEMKALPRFRQRVLIRERVPQDVVEEVLQSKRDAPSGKLPEKMLWVYLAWTDVGVKFRWSIEREPTSPQEKWTLRSGGDEIENP